MNTDVMKHCKIKRYRKYLRDYNWYLLVSHYNEETKRQE